jgi:hypothetical protein
MTYWHRFSQWSLLGAAALAAVLGSRLLLVAWERWEAPKEAPKTYIVPRPTVAVGDIGRHLPVLDPAGIPLPAELISGKREATGGDVPVLLFVVTEGPRRDVIVNGSVLGQSPYMGQIYCDRGSTVRVTLRTKEGLETLVERACVPEIRIAD